MGDILELVDGDYRVSGAIDEVWTKCLRRFWEVKYIVRGKSALLYAMAQLEPRYDPPAGPNATDIQTVAVPVKDKKKTECVMKAEPAKRLVSLAGIPVLVMTAEASYHAVYEYCSVGYLRQAGVQAKHLELGK